MQIWKFHYTSKLILDQYPENFAFLILKNLELFTCFFLELFKLLFNIFHCFSMFVNKHFIYLGSA